MKFLQTKELPSVPIGSHIHPRSRTKFVTWGHYVTQSSVDIQAQLLPRMMFESMVLLWLGIS